MQGDFFSMNEKAGTVGGTLLVLLLQLSATELLKTAILAGIGAAVSFLVSLSLKYIISRLGRKKESR